jgi:hypothetical protein
VTRLLALSCRAFPSDHRARQSDEVVDTALLAANGSAWRTVGEASSLVVAGLYARLRAESHRSAREGLTLLAWALALVNLAVALAGISLFFVVKPPWANSRIPFAVGIDWWWIAFAVAAAGVVLGLALGNRWLAVGSVLANLAIVGYDAISLVDNSLNDIRPAGAGGHLDVFTSFNRVLYFPAERQWFAVAAILALATIAAPLRRLPLRRLGYVSVAVLLLVVLSRLVAGYFAFLVWPILVLVVLGIVFGAVAPRFAVLAIGLTLAAVASANTYLTTAYLPAPAGLPSAGSNLVVWGVTVGLLLGVLLPLGQLARRRLT